MLRCEGHPVSFWQEGSLIICTTGKSFIRRVSLRLAGVHSAHNPCPLRMGQTETCPVLETFLGEGTFGVVTQLPNSNVKKVAKRCTREGYDDFASFHAELRFFEAHQAVSIGGGDEGCPHLPQLISAVPDEYTLVMPYGDTLHNFVQTYKNSTSDCPGYFISEKGRGADISRGVIRAVQYLHETLFIAHCDIKPANVCIMLPSHRPVLIDMGASVCLDVPRTTTGITEYLERAIERIPTPKVYPFCTTTLPFRIPAEQPLQMVDARKVDTHSLMCTLFYIVTRGVPLVAWKSCSPHKIKKYCDCCCNPDRVISSPELIGKRLRTVASIVLSQNSLPGLSTPHHAFKSLFPFVLNHANGENIITELSLNSLIENLKSL